MCVCAEVTVSVSIFSIPDPAVPLCPHVQCELHHRTITSEFQQQTFNFYVVRLITQVEC